MKVLSNILIAVVALAAAAGIGILAAVMVNNADFKVELAAEGVTTGELALSAGGMVPGQSNKFDVEFKCKSDGDYNLELAFKGPQTPLNQYVAVSIKCGEYSGGARLAELIDGKSLSFDFAISSGKCKMTIEYTLLSSAGNELQGEKADFKVLISAARR